MPEGSVYVGRPTKWCNPFKASDFAGSTQSAVDAFRTHVESYPAFVQEIQSKLKGKQLVCWCNLNLACHGDVLAEIANRE
jgi:hypothetical protein